MEDPNSTLLPYILEALSRKTDLCDSFDQLCEDIADQLKREHSNNNYGNVRNAIQRAVSVGQSLGIITLTEELVRVPFNFCAKGDKAPPTMVWKAQAQPEIGTGNPLPSRSVVVTNNVPPTVNSPTANTGVPSAVKPLQTQPITQSLTKVSSRSEALKRTALARAKAKKAKARALARAKAKAKLKAKARSRALLNRARSRTRGRPPLRRKQSVAKRFRGRTKRRSLAGRPRRR